MKENFPTSTKSKNKIKLSCAIAIAIIWLTLLLNAQFNLLTIFIGVLCSLLIPFGIIMIFNYPKNVCIDIDSESLGFHVLAAADSPFVFHFSEIDKIVVGSVKSAFRQNRNTFRKFYGIELQISEQIDEYTVHYNYSFPLKHIDNYPLFIEKVQEYAKAANVPFERRIS